MMFVLSLFVFIYFHTFIFLYFSFSYIFNSPLPPTMASPNPTHGEYYTPASLTALLEKSSMNGARVGWLRSAAAPNRDSAWPLWGGSRRRET